MKICLVELQIIFEVFFFHYALHVKDYFLSLFHVGDDKWAPFHG